MQYLDPGHLAPSNRNRRPLCRILKSLVAGHVRVFTTKCTALFCLTSGFVWVRHLIYRLLSLAWSEKSIGGDVDAGAHVPAQLFQSFRLRT